MVAHELLESGRVARQLHGLAQQRRIVEHVLYFRVALHERLHLRIAHHDVAQHVRIGHDALDHRVVEHLTHRVRIAHQLLLQLRLHVGEVRVAHAEHAQIVEQVALATGTASAAAAKRQVEQISGTGCGRRRRCRLLLLLGWLGRRSCCARRCRCCSWFGLRLGFLIRLVFEFQKKRKSREKKSTHRLGLDDQVNGDAVSDAVLDERLRVLEYFAREYQAQLLDRLAELVADGVFELENTANNNNAEAISNLHCNERMSQNDRSENLTSLTLAFLSTVTFSFSFGVLMVRWIWLAAAASVLEVAASGSVFAAWVAAASVDGVDCSPLLVDVAVASLLSPLLFSVFIASVVVFIVASDAASLLVLLLLSSIALYYQKMCSNVCIGSLLSLVQVCFSEAIGLDRRGFRIYFETTTIVNSF